MVKINNTSFHYSKEKTINQMFEEQVNKNPDRTAVIFKNEKLTYRELNSRANSLAHILREEGIGRDSLVPIMVDKSIEMIVGIVGIMKSGGAYIPIDPKYPQNRIDYMLNDCKSEVLISTKKLSKNIEFEGKKINMDDNELFRDKKENLPVINRASDLAYVIYTSGTTGKPKGVMIEQKSLLNITHYIIDELDIKEEDTSGVYISFSFDPCVLEIWPYLVKGAALNIIPEEVRINLDKLEKFYEENKITITILPTQMAEYFIKRKNSTLRYLLTGGEKLKNVSKEDIINKKYTLINNYGPTETTIFSTNCVVGEIDGDIPIGKPIANTQIYILDDNLNVVKDGEVGELFIGGDGVARGYLYKEELTKEKFIQNPFGEGRIYKSGDLVYIKDGSIHFIQRKDHQVKVNGYRIELGEIESCILEYEHIKEVAVVVKENEAGRKNINAYFVAHKTILPEELKGFLEKKLPYYMIPAFFTQLDEMPLTVNGKIDKNILIKEYDNEYCEKNGPENQLQRELLNVWIKYLGINEIGIDESFFDVGGNSLVGTMILSEIFEKVGAALEMKDLFEYETVMKLAERIEELKNCDSEYRKIVREEHREYYPAASAQKRMFMIQSSNRNSTAYNETLIYKITGNSSDRKIEEIVNTLVKRHESLRAEFKVVRGEIKQRFREDVKIKLEYFNDIDNIQKQVEGFVKPFDLEKDRLFRVGIMRGKCGKYLVIDMHHIIIDGYSIDVLQNELEDLLNGYNLPDLEYRYRDYACFHNDIINSSQIDNQEKYWKAVFQKDIQSLDLIPDYERESTRSFSGGRVDKKIGKDTLKDIDEICKRLKLTQHMFFLTAAKILLYKYTGQEDIIIGSPVSGRNHPYLENMVGMFVNTVPIRTKVKGSISVHEYLKTVRSTTLNGYKNQDFQFDKMVEMFNIRSDDGRNPVFDVMFNYKDTAGDFKIENQNVEIERYYIEDKRAKFDLSFNIQKSEDGIISELEYDDKLFCKSTAEKLNERYIRVIRSMIENEESLIGDISLINDEEKAIILESFNDTDREYPRDKTIYQLFEEQCLEKKNKTAVVYKEKYLTYEQLRVKSRCIANILLNNGVRKNSVVGIMGEKNQNTIAAMLGILGAGAAYLPIEKNYPKDRMNYMLQNSGCEILLMTEEGTIDVEFKGKIISVEKCLQSNDSEEFTHEGEASDYAYVIYTSGTTGKPKGVLGSNRNIVRLVKNITYVEFSDEDRILQTGSISFDASTFEIWGALLNGLTLYMADLETVVVPELLKEFLQKKDITILWLTSELFNQVADKDPKIFKGLRYLMAGGDVLSPKRVNSIRENCSDTIFINGYGPTENTTFSTVYHVSEHHNKKIPIGKPNDNSKAYIFDKDMNLLPIGVKGELYVGGEGLAYGYINRDELTESKFIDNPFRRGEKIYKTGDMVRWMEDGNIEFFEREDNQVKIRGFRIELGEIENKLLKIQGITSAAVVVYKKRGNKEIAVFITTDSEIEKSKVRKSLESDLPRYMVPSIIEIIEEMPVTPNGKLDKKKLCRMDISEENVERVEARNDKEAFLVKEFCEIMGFQSIGVNENLLELGANSLKLMIFTQRIKSRYEIEYNAIFENPHISNIAKIIKENNKVDSLNVEQIKERLAEKYMLPDHKTIEEIKRERESYIKKVDSRYAQVDLEQKKEYKNILLTGATGYLGGNILNELLKKTHSDITVLIRGENVSLGEERLREKLAYYFGEQFYHHNKSRINIVIGDISKPCFGMKSEEYLHLCSICDAVINSAADVRHFGPYEQFYRANVLSVENLIEFAKMGTPKDLTHISTVSVASGRIPESNYRLYTEFDLDVGQVSSNNYVKTKTEAEKVLQRAVEDGVEVKIFRVGNIVFNSNTGKCQYNIENNAFYQKVKSYIRLNSVPEIQERNIDFSFVDEVSRAVVKLFQCKELKSDVFHISNNNVISISEFGEIYNECFNKEPLEIMDIDSYLQHIKKSYANRNKKKYVDTLLLHTGILNDEEANFEVLDYKTLHLLNRLKFKWTEVSHSHIKNMINYAHEIGFIE